MQKLMPGTPLKFIPLRLETRGFTTGIFESHPLCYWTITMARSSRSKSPAPKAKAAGNATTSTIQWGNMNVTPLTTPLVVFAVVHIIYAVEMLGFQVTDGEFKPSFKAANPCTKYLKDATECEADSTLQAMYIIFGVNLIGMQISALVCAFRDNLDMQVTYARTRMIQTQAVITMMAASVNSVNDTQYKVGMLLQIALAFYLQNSLRNQGTGKALGDRDFHKHGQIGYVYLAFFLCFFFYFFNACVYSGIGFYTEKAAAELSANTMNIWAWWAMSQVQCTADMLIAFEYQTTAELTENIIYMIPQFAIGLYFAFNSDVFAAAWKPQCLFEMKVIFSVFAGACGYFGKDNFM